MTPKVYAKAFLAYPNQITARSNLRDNSGRGYDGIELYLRNTDFEKPESELSDLVKLASDTFPIVNLETGDRLDPKGEHPADLLDPECQRYVERVLGVMDKMPNAGYLVVHLAGDCQRLKHPYNGLKVEKKGLSLAKALDYIRKVDPENKRIALENTFPTDWMNEPDHGKHEDGVIAFYPFGKLSADFRERARVFDPGHSGITMYTFAKTSSILGNYGSIKTNYGSIKTPEYGIIPVYLGDEESKIADIAKRSLTEAVKGELASIKNLRGVHVNGSLALSDGKGLNEGSDFDLKEVLRVLKQRKDLDNIVLVTEFKEPSRDYINVPNQAEGLKFLRDFFSS